MDIDLVALWIGRVVLYGGASVGAVAAFFWTVNWVGEWLADLVVEGLDWLSRRKERRCRKRHG